VGAELFHKDGRTDGQTEMNLIVAVRSFWKRVMKTDHALCEVRGVGNN